MMKRPAPDRSANERQRLRPDGRLEAVREDALRAFPCAWPQVSFQHRSNRRKTHFVIARAPRRPQVLCSQLQTAKRPATGAPSGERRSSTARIQTDAATSLASIRLSGIPGSRPEDDPQIERIMQKPPGGISPPGAPRSRREPLDLTRLPMFLGRFHGTAANERRASDLCGEADQTRSRAPLVLRRSRLNLRRAQRMT